MLLARFRCKGPAKEAIDRIRKNPAFKRAKFQYRARAPEVRRLIVAIGQVHPVLTGKFGWLQARKIGVCQGWIFDACHALLRDFHVSSFGQEGFGDMSDAVVRVRIDEGLLAHIRKEADEHHEAKGYLKNVAQDWRKSLRGADTDKANRMASLLNGVAVLQAIDPRVTIFPIEQKDVHSAVGENIDRIQREIHAVENTSAYRRCRGKGGKGLTPEEYETAMKRNDIIKAYNRALASPERDRSILREVIEHAVEPITVYVLGQAHRPRQLKIANQHIPEDVLYVWITPPVFWWWKAIQRRILTGVIISAFLIEFFLF